MPRRRLVALRLRGGRLGDVGRFAGPGNFASYARMVDSRRESNGKKKGVGNTKCGNKYLAWAFIEAAHFAVRYDAAIKRWYQKKCASSLSVVLWLGSVLACLSRHTVEGSRPSLRAASASVPS